MSASTLIDRLAFGSWAVAVVFQTITAVRDGWNSFRGQPIPRDRRLLDGESVNGWRRIIPSPADGVRYASGLDFIIVPPVIGDQEPEGGQGGDGFSLDLALFPRLLDDRKTCQIRRYSRLRPRSTLMLEMIYDPRHFHCQVVCYIDSSTIAATFRQEGSRNFKIVFLTVMTRKVRQLLVEGPEEGIFADDAYLSTSPKRQLHIIYGAVKEENGNLRGRLVDSRYDLPPIDSPIPSIIRPSSWVSISVPFDNRSGFRFDSDQSLVYVVFDNTDAGNAENHICVSIDSEKNWRIDSMAAWLAKFQNTRFGASVLGAIQGVAAFAPLEIFRDPPLYCHKYVLPLLAKTEILATFDQFGILQRRLAPSSLKGSAVAAVCKGYPDAEMSAIKDSTGVDVSDGIVEGGDGDEDCQVIYL